MTIAVYNIKPVYIVFALALVFIPLFYSFISSVFAGTDILGHPMIVEPSHQQRLSTRSASGKHTLCKPYIHTYMPFLQSVERHGLFCGFFVSQA